MGGSSHPGEVITFKVLFKVGKHILIEVDDEEEREYLVKDTVYIGPITPKPE